jgi:hypothetical protein
MEINRTKYYTRLLWLRIRQQDKASAWMHFFNLAGYNSPLRIGRMANVLRSIGYMPMMAGAA